jgi:hypothetical protein
MRESRLRKQSALTLSTPKEFLTTEVLYTIVDGKTVYEKR